MQHSLGNFIKKSIHDFLFCVLVLNYAITANDILQQYILNEM